MILCILSYLDFVFGDYVDGWTMNVYFLVLYNLAKMSYLTSQKKKNFQCTWAFRNNEMRKLQT